MPREAVGALVKAVRERTGITQRELARRASLTSQYVSSIERGEIGKPNDATLWQIAAALGCAPDEIGGSAPPPLWESGYLAGLMEAHRMIGEAIRAFEAAQESHSTPT